MNLKANYRPRLAVWKLASCDGCQLTLLDCEDELLAIADRYDIAHFYEMTKNNTEGYFDVSLVEGSIFTKKDILQIHEIRKNSKYVVAIGACATAGGIQALRNFKKDPNYISVVYAREDYIDTLERSSAISEYVKVDFELRGCPINKKQLLQVLLAFLNNCKPRIPNESVCMQCKASGVPCVMVTQGRACLGPVTHAGCDALCPKHQRPCYGCYGPKENANTHSLACEFKALETSNEEIIRLFRSFNADAPEFSKESRRHD